MKKKDLSSIVLLVFSVIISSCSGGKKITSENSSLRDAFKNDFLIGAALSADQIEEKDAGSAPLIAKHFSAATPENIMKSEVIHPGWDQYNFDLADKLVAYGKNHDIKISRYVNGKYQEPESLSDSINSKGYEFNAFVDPDEQFILYTAYRRPEGQGSGDLYISRKTASGEWGAGVNLKVLSSPYMDYCPFVTADKKYLYFTSDRPQMGLPFTAAKKAKDISAILGSAGNGFDDIYVLPFSALQ